MKRFIFKITGFFSLIIVILILSIYIFPPAPSYLAAFKQKTTLLDSTESPRLIFVGGSNIAFGLDSKAIMDSMGMNVVNTGLHAGIGLKSMLDTTEPYLKKGDYVIIAPEYSQFYGTFNGSEVLAMVSFREGWTFVKYFDSMQLANMVEYLPEVIIRNIIENFNDNNKAPSPLYSQNGFNEYGDFTNHWSHPRMRVNIDEISSDFDSIASDYVAKKLELWRSKGVAVYIFPPVIIHSYYTKNERKINLLSVELQKRGIGFVVNPQRHVLPDTMAFDTPYHMSKYGVQENTRRTIEDLQNIIVQHGVPFD